MAAAPPWKDVDKFCTCSICYDQFEEPKLLPCLHRFCRECLDNLLKASVGTFKCPECREEMGIPTDGVDEFKTDFYMKNLVEYVHIQQSLRSEEVRECYGCLKHFRAVAYCFRCRTFLCTDCHHAHMENQTLDNHKEHTLSVTDIESNNVTYEKLAFMRDAPGCHVHPTKESELLCETCDNVPICVACMHGKHKGHDLHEVTELARVKREMLTEKLEVLEKMKADSSVTVTSKLKDMLIQNVANEKEKLQRIYNHELREEEKKLKRIKWKINLTKDWKENSKKKVFDTLQRDMEREIQEVKNKYRDMCREKENQIDDKFCVRENCLSRQLANSSERSGEIEKERKETLETIELQLNENLHTIETTVQHFDNVDKRLQNLNVTASSIVASENDWTAVKCIPDLCDAASRLVEDLKKEFPELETLAHEHIDYQQPGIGRQHVYQVMEQEEKKLTLTDAYYHFNGMASDGDGNIVISGCPLTGTEAFIIVLDMSGNIIKQKKLIAAMRAPWHGCDFLSQHKVAFAYAPNTIGVYNVCDGSYFTKIISDVISSWPVDRKVRCVATDPVNNHILVGGKDSRDMYVFDDQLNYIRTLTLPEVIQWPRDISVDYGQLLVCDYDGKKSYVTTMEGLQSKVVFEFMKPDLDAEDLRPLSVCTDQEGFVYMLWQVPFGAQCCLVQYSQYGGQIVTTRKVDGNARIVTAVTTVEGPKIIVATHSTQTVYLYGVIEENFNREI